MAESIVQDECLNLLQHDDIEEENIDSETVPKMLTDNRSSTSRFSLPLREGKQYHLFIAHSDTDKHYAKTVMYDLEDKFGFRCMYADRDFLPGKGIVENINEKVLQSQMMLLILTPDFKKSYYCNQEMNEAFRLAEQENRFNTIIPLLPSTKCAQDAIPRALRSLTYIDAEKEDDVAMKIHQMYCRMIEAEQWPTDMDRGMDSLQQNGAVLLTTCVEKYNPSRIRGIRWEFKELSGYQQRSLEQDEVEVCKIYKTLTEMLNACQLLRMYGIHESNIRKLLHGFILGTIVSLLLLGSLELYAVVISTDYYILFIPIVLIFSVPSTLLILFLQFLVIKTHVKEIDRCIWNFNKKLLKKSPYLVAYEWPKPQKPRINIIRYDSSKCQLLPRIITLEIISISCLKFVNAMGGKEVNMQYLCLLLKGMHPELSDAEIEERATSKIESLLWSNRKQIFNWSALPTSPSNRHNVYMNKACLCEMVVSLLQEL